MERSLTGAVGFFALDEDHLWIENSTEIAFKENLAYFNGKVFRNIQTPNTAGIRSLWFVSPTSGWAGCEHGQIMHWDGRAWRLVPCPSF